MTPDLPTRFAAFQQQYPLCTCVVEGQQWEYIAGGAGEVFLLLPGFFGVASTDFLYILHFAPHYRAIAITYPETCASVEALVDGLAGFMDQLGIARAHILGGSYSGYIAQVFVRRYPQRVGKLILAQTGAPRIRHVPLALTLVSLFWCVPHGVLHHLMRHSMRQFLPHATPTQDFWRAHFMGLIQTFSHRALYHRFRVALDYHQHYRFAPADLAHWPGALLLLESAHETLLASDDAALLRQLYPQAQAFCVPGDHIQSVEQPEAQMAVMLQFLQETCAL